MPGHWDHPPYEGGYWNHPHYDGYIRALGRIARLTQLLGPFSSEHDDPKWNIHSSVASGIKGVRKDHEKAVGVPCWIGESTHHLSAGVDRFQITRRRTWNHKFLVNATFQSERMYGGSRVL